MWIFIMIVSVCGTRKMKDIRNVALLSIAALVEGLSLFVTVCFDSFTVKTGPIVGLWAYKFTA